MCDWADHGNNLLTSAFQSLLFCSCLTVIMIDVKHEQWSYVCVCHDNCVMINIKIVYM